MSAVFPTVLGTSGAGRYPKVKGWGLSALSLCMALTILMFGLVEPVGLEEAGMGWALLVGPRSRKRYESSHPMIQILLLH